MSQVSYEFCFQLNEFGFFLLDYVGFIKKIMKQLQKGYNEVQALEIELRILETTSAPPSRPRKYFLAFEFSLSVAVPFLFESLVVEQQDLVT